MVLTGKRAISDSSRVPSQRRPKLTTKDSVQCPIVETHHQIPLHTVLVFHEEFEQRSSEGHPTSFDFAIGRREGVLRQSRIRVILKAQVRAISRREGEG